LGRSAVGAAGPRLLVKRLLRLVQKETGFDFGAKRIFRSQQSDGFPLPLDRCFEVAGLGAGRGERIENG
jgi:hypothetical protein